MLVDDGSIKVLDFGIAKLLDQVFESQCTSQGLVAGASASTHDASAAPALASREGAVIGTMPYMSPEQWGADDIDARSDLWAVGIMLWELCTGRHPL